jgi:hypothetical protein
LKEPAREEWQEEEEISDVDSQSNQLTNEDALNLPLREGAFSDERRTQLMEYVINTT